MRQIPNKNQCHPQARRNNIIKVLTIGILIFVICFGFSISNFEFVPAAQASQAVKPQTIPCVPSLPCVNEATQQTPGGVQQHVTTAFGVTFLQGFLGISAVTAVIFIIIGGMQMHLALGNEDEIKKAKQTLLWAIVGLVISILSVTVVRIVSNLPFTSSPPTP